MNKKSNEIADYMYREIIRYRSLDYQELITHIEKEFGSKYLTDKRTLHKSILNKFATLRKNHTKDNVNEKIAWDKTYKQWTVEILNVSDPSSLHFQDFTEIKNVIETIDLDLPNQFQ